jgi:hypothetical protein
VWSLAFVLFLVALALPCPLCRRDVKDWSTCCNKCVISLLGLVFVSHLVISDNIEILKYLLNYGIKIWQNVPYHLTVPTAVHEGKHAWLQSKQEIALPEPSSVATHTHHMEDDTHARMPSCPRRSLAVSPATSAAASTSEPNQEPSLCYNMPQPTEPICSEIWSMS